MADALVSLVWLVLDFVLVCTGRAVVWAVSFGRWRGERQLEGEAKTYAGAGALWFEREGRHIFTATGLLFVGIAFYVALVFALIAYAAKV